MDVKFRNFTKVVFVIFKKTLLCMFGILVVKVSKLMMSQKQETDPEVILHPLQEGVLIICELNLPITLKKS